MDSNTHSTFLTKLTEPIKKYCLDCLWYNALLEMLESPSEYELAGLDEPERTEAIKCGYASCNACLQTLFSSAGVQAKQESRIADQQSKCVWKFE